MCNTHRRRGQKDGHGVGVRVDPHVHGLAIHAMHCTQWGGASQGKEKARACWFVKEPGMGVAW